MPGLWKIVQNGLICESVAVVLQEIEVGAI